MNKTIAIVGGTGLIGTKVAKLLVDKGYKVGIYSRNADQAKKTHQFANFHYQFDLARSEWKEPIKNSHAVINLAGAPIAGSKWTDKYKQLIIDSRIESTKAIISAICEDGSNVKTLINASAVGYYGNAGDHELDENSLHGAGFLSEVTRKWETTASQVCSQVRLILARIGIVLDRDDGALSEMSKPFQFFIGGPLGSGNQYIPWVHIEDIAEMFAFALDSSLSGPVNFVGPQPITNKEFAKSLGKAMRRPSIFPTPIMALKFILGEQIEMITNSQKAYPRKLTEAGFKFKFDNVQHTLNTIYNS